MDGCLHVGRVLGGTISGGLQRNGAEVASCCNTLFTGGEPWPSAWAAAADTMAFMHRVSGWLGWLSGPASSCSSICWTDGGDLRLSILIHEKYLAIDAPTRKEVGTTYAAVVRRVDGQFLDASQQPPLVVARCAHPAGGRVRGPRRASYAPPMSPSGLAWRCSNWRAARGLPTVDPQTLTRQRSQLLRGARAAHHGGQPVQPDPGPGPGQLLRDVAGGAAVSRVAAGGA